MEAFNGLGMHLGNLSRLSAAKSRSISPENFSGEKGKGGMAVPDPEKSEARDLGQGWKVSPYFMLEAGGTRELADIEGPGAIQHIWITQSARQSRLLILRIYWDGSEQPSVECPLGDFFANGWEQYAPVNSLAVCVNPVKGYNCYWEMPFRKRCRVTLSNLWHEKVQVYYQIDYTLTEVPADAAYFHAQFRRVNPLPFKQPYTILDGVKGRGHYVGTYMAWGTKSGGWWGEGEIKFFMDGDQDFPTICGTGTEDYFCGAYCFDMGKEKGGYTGYSTAYAGLPQIIRPDGQYQSQTRFGMYRWHIMDPVRFEKDLKVNIQALGWNMKARLWPLQEDLASVAFWYQTLPAAPFPALPDASILEII